MIQRKLQYPRVVFLAFITVLIAAGSIPFICNPGHAESREQKAVDKEMQTETLPCPKCKGQMESGVVLDYWDSSSWTQTQWALGNPKSGFFSGTPKTKKVFTFRCITCGYLESYAK